LDIPQGQEEPDRQTVNTLRVLQTKFVWI